MVSFTPWLFYSGERVPATHVIGDLVGLTDPYWHCNMKFLFRTSCCDKGVNLVHCTYPLLRIVSDKEISTTHCFGVDSELMSIKH